jgi:GNAT superfamily N-acetyltransferase
VDTLSIRRAQVSDIAEVTRLRDVMFHEMDVDWSNQSWRESTMAYLTRHIPLENIIGAVMDRPNEQGLCAAGLLRIQEVPGSPLFPRGMVGHIGSVAVDPPWRRQGIGERIVTFLIDEARSHGLERLELHATPGGEGIYGSPANGVG